MSNNKSSTSKTSDNSRTSKNSSEKCKTCIKTPKKVIPSQKIPPSCPKNKSCPTSVACLKKCPTKPKKTIKSDMIVTDKCKYKNNSDFCKNCGDALDNEPQIKDEEIDKIITNMNINSVCNDNNININKVIKHVQQYYKNENFQSYPESTENIKKSSLDTIKEVSEHHSKIQSFNASQDSMFMIYSDSDDDITNLDPDNDDNIEKLKQFRNKNYFECHSAKSRIKTRPSVTSLNNHKCVYRFYLNDRLFPVPLNTDYNNKVRCVECHLPMDINHDVKDAKINGTIQAKVKLGENTQDVVLLLPVKESLIIKERRKEEKKINDEYVYFGVVKLSADGNSIFKKTLPEDSLALKYQKGYKEHLINNRYKYKNIDDDDVIVI